MNAPIYVFPLSQDDDRKVRLGVSGRAVVKHDANWETFTENMPGLKGMSGPAGLLWFRSRTMAYWAPLVAYPDILRSQIMLYGALTRKYG